MAAYKRKETKLFYSDKYGARAHIRPHHHREDLPGDRAGRGDRGERGTRGPRGFGRGPFQHGRWWEMRDFRGPRAMVRRGDVRTAILVLLAERPMHGYEVIQQLGERSGGRWVPSAGSVYPTLQQLEDEGLVKGEEREGRNVYALTEEGGKAAAQASERPAPWSVHEESPDDLFGTIRPLMAAVAQVHQVGNPDSIERAAAILVEARRQLYQLLAEEGTTAATDR